MSEQELVIEGGGKVPPMRAGYIEMTILSGSPNWATIWFKPSAITAIHTTIWSGSPAFMFNAGGMWFYTADNPLDAIEAYECAKLEGKMR